MGDVLGGGGRGMVVRRGVGRDVDLEGPNPQDTFYGRRRLRNVVLLA